MQRSAMSTKTICLTNQLNNAEINPLQSTLRMVLQKPTVTNSRRFVVITQNLPSSIVLLTSCNSAEIFYRIGFTTFSYFVTTEETFFSLLDSFTMVASHHCRYLLRSARRTAQETWSLLQEFASFCLEELPMTSRHSCRNFLPFTLANCFRYVVVTTFCFDELPVTYRH
ncbi:hypothetical protein PoB_003306000 [Plakobranchus ocellatus]|uniref:Uncharacterized protein n=1 Tax=Plakobranchus ocellatus TaxID=259542 RepID=A0AAV4AID9_9GAST|nr:hypothetical protein PoB_003306000 [Plakobranchus ocellatus]